MQNDILFDNIYIGHSVEDAAKFADETFHEKRAAEQLAELADKPKEPERPKSPSDLTFTEDPVSYVKSKVDLFITIAKQDPIQAIQFVPEVAIGLAVGALTLLGVLIGLLTTLGAPAPEKVKKVTKDAKEQVTDGTNKAASAAASAVDQGKAEAKKRTTRNKTSE